MKNKLILSIIFIIAFYLRFDAYLLNNSFFTDEVLLAFNTLSKSYLSLLKPLDFFQSAPYLFLVFTKLIVSNFGVNELCFRFIPFVSGIFSVIVFYKLCNLILKTSLSKYIALISFGLNYQLLFYSQTFKQYSTDVLLALLFVYFAIKYNNKIQTIKQFTMFGIFCTIGLFTSFPLFFVIPAIFITMFILNKNKRLKIIYSSIYPITAIFIYYFYNLRFVKNSTHLLNYWTNGFDVFSLNMYKNCFDFLFFYDHFHILLFILVIIGLYYTFKKNTMYFYIIVFTLLFGLIAAFLKLYPFENRLILYIIPFIILLSALPIDNLPENIYTKSLVIIISAIFFLSGYFNFSKLYITGKISYLRQDVKPLLKVLKTNKKEHEKIYIYYSALATYSYYALFKDIPKTSLIAPTIPQQETSSEKYLINDLNHLTKGTYYLLFIKGTNTYEKDIQYTNEWIKLHAVQLTHITLKSACLYKIKI